jgi:hypothetical protein
VFSEDDPDLWGPVFDLDVACKEEQWRLTKHTRFGWELDLERPDGALLGSYQGRRWRNGGSIELANGTRAKLRRSLLSNNWQIQNPHGAICEILSRPYMGTLTTGGYAACGGADRPS